MYVEYLSLANFRNFTRLDLEIPPGLTVILGENAQGKSNLLEAVHVMATTKSFRASSDREMINWQALDDAMPVARIVGRVRRGQRPLRLEVVIQEEPRNGNGGNGAPATGTVKRLRVNDVPKRAIDVIGQAKVVMFSPQDTDLVAGSPLLRRRYIDVTISQVDPRYCRSLAHYSKVVVQRNHLLRQVREQMSRPELLDFWDREMIEAGSYIIAQRLSTMRHIDQLAKDVHRQLAYHRENLKVGYRSSLQPVENGHGVRESSDALFNGLPEGGLEACQDHVKTLYKRRVAGSRGREVAAGFSLFGPHRDDLVFWLDDRDSAAYGSRGQQRTVALALKLAEAEFMRQQTGTCPILLLDDVMSELDQERRRQVLKTAATCRQAIITSTDPHVFDRGTLDSSNVLHLENGLIAVR